MKQPSKKVRQVTSGPDTSAGRGVSADGIDYWLKDIVEMYGDRELTDPHAINTILCDIAELVPRLVELDERRRLANQQRNRADKLKNRLDAAGRALSRIANARDGEDSPVFIKAIARDAILYECETPCARPAGGNACSCHMMDNGARWENPNCPVHFPQQRKLWRPTKRQS